MEIISETSEHSDRSILLISLNMPLLKCEGNETCGVRIVRKTNIRKFSRWFSRVGHGWGCKKTERRIWLESSSKANRFYLITLLCTCAYGPLCLGKFLKKNFRYRFVCNVIKVDKKNNSDLWCWRAHEIAFCFAVIDDIDLSCWRRLRCKCCECSVHRTTEYMTLQIANVVQELGRIRQTVAIKFNRYIKSLVRCCFLAWKETIKDSLCSQSEGGG